jgi:hypothetical protein
MRMCKYWHYSGDHMHGEGCLVFDRAGTSHRSSMDDDAFHNHGQLQGEARETGGGIERE